MTVIHTQPVKEHLKSQIELVVFFSVLGISRLTESPGELLFFWTKAWCGIQL